MTINLNLMDKLNKISVLNNRISDIPENIKSLSAKVNSYHQNRTQRSKDENIDDKEIMALLRFALKNTLDNNEEVKTYPFWVWNVAKEYDFSKLNPRLTDILIKYHVSEHLSKAIPVDLIKAVNENVLNNDLIHDSANVPSTLIINLWERYHGTGVPLSENTISIFAKQWEQICYLLTQNGWHLSSIFEHEKHLIELLDFSMFLTTQVEASKIHEETVKHSRNLLIDCKNTKDSSTKTYLNLDLVNDLKKLLNSEKYIPNQPLYVGNTINLLKKINLTSNQVEDIASVGKGMAFLYELTNIEKESRFITPIHNLKGYLEYGKSLSDTMLPPHIKKYIHYLVNEMDIVLDNHENYHVFRGLELMFELFGDKKKFFENVLLKLDKPYTIVFLEMFKRNNYANETKSVFNYIHNFINVNTLTPRTLIELMQIKSKNLYTLPISFEITIDEYLLLCEKRDFPYISEIHEKMGNWKIAERIDALKILPSISQDLMKAILRTVDENDFVFSVVKFVHQSNAKHYRSQFNNQMLSKGNAFIVSAFASSYPILQQATTDWELWLLFNTLDTSSVQTVEDAKKWYMTKSTDVKELTKWLELSDSFLLDNTDRILNFLRNGLYKITLQHYQNSSNKKKDNIKLLAKAEIAGKLKDIKLKKEGVEAEILEVISDELYEKWYADKAIKEEVVIADKKGTAFKFTIKETTDYGTLLRMGRIPTRSCMDWEDGVFKSCLLSIFDSNKKLVVATVNGQVVARAILRLTKLADTNIKVSFNSSALTFDDVDSTQGDIGSNSSSTTLFLERMYTTYTGEQLNAIKNAMVNVIAEKAKEMGVAFSTSVGYQSTDVVNLYNESKYLLISHSKNGEQYLDSLGGSADVSDGGSYKKAEIKVMHN